MKPSIRFMIASLLIAAVSPLGLAALNLEQPAYAKNGNGGGNGGGHGGGNGGGHGGSKGGGHGGGNNGGNGGGQANGHAKADKAAVSEDDAEAPAATGKPSKKAKLDAEEDDGSLAPSGLGKLNGVLHASPQAIANASVNSPIGKAREFGLALADFIGTTAPEEDPEADPEAEANEDPVTVDDLGALMAGMTNKPVTAAQVQAVADRLAADDPENESLQDIDPDLAQDIADEANAIHGFDSTDEDSEPDDEEAEAEVALE